MIKFMRKHNKKLLAIFASALLIVWLGSTALQQMFTVDPGDEPAGAAFGQEFLRRDLALAANRMDIINALGLYWDRPWGAAYRLPIDPIDRLTWYLLDCEARRSGIEIPEREVQRLLTARQIPGKALENIRDRQRRSVQDIYACVGDYIRINRMGTLAASAVAVSNPEVEHFVRDTGEKISVRMAVLKASSFADPKADPDPAAIEAHFHKFQETLPGEGENGYGYMWPDRIRLQYLLVDLDEVQKAVRIPDDEVHSYWREHRSEYTKEVPLATQAASQPTTTTGPTASAPTSTSKPATKTVIKSLAEARDQVAAEMKVQRAPLQAEKIIRQAADRLLEPWYDVKLDEATGYKPAPPDVDAPDYLDKIAAEIRKRNELPDDALRVVKPNRWLTRDAITDLEGIGQAVVEGRQSDEDAPTDLVGLAFQVQGLYMPEKHSRERGLALYQTCNTPLRDMKDGEPHDYFLFRTVAAQPSHKPEVSDEIADTLRKDVIELEGYRRAGAAARRLLAAAAAKGVEPAVKADADLTKRLGEAGVISPEPFARKRNLGQFAIQFGLPMTMLWPIEELGVVEEQKVGTFPVPMKMVADRYEPEVTKLIDACFGLAPEPAAASKPTRAVTLVEMPKSKQWVVVEFVKIERVPSTDFARSQRQIRDLLQSDRTLEMLRAWYDPEEVKRRVDYAPAKEEEEEES